MENTKGKKISLALACITLGAAIAAQYLFQCILVLMPMSDAALTWTAVVANQVILFGACFLFCRNGKVNLLEITGVKRAPKWYYFPVIVLIALSCVFCFAPIAGLFARLLEKIGYDHPVNYFIPMKNAGLFTLAFFALTILPAIGEETAFRGVLLNGGKERSALFAVLFSALIFSLMHGNVTQLIHQFLLGLIMGYLAYIFGGIYASATVHIVNNGFVMIAEYGFNHGWIDPRAYWYLNGESSGTTTMLGVLIAFFALATLLVFVTLLRHKERAKKGDYLGATASEYLDYLSGVPAYEKGKEGEDSTEKGKRITPFAWLLLAMLVLVLALGVVVNVFFGAK